MCAAQASQPTDSPRGLLARPLDSLLFLAPLLIFYETVSLVRASRVIAFDFTQRFFELFGYAGMWAPTLAVMVILLATHVASGEKWRIHWNGVAVMYVEALVLAVPLLALNWAIPLTAADPATVSDPLGRIAVGIGAGIYEELVFRLVLISLLVMVGVDLLKLSRTAVACGAVVLSSLAFAAHHHPPLGIEPFAAAPFLFRTMAGAYLALVFWYRGYGPAAGCHAAYNVALSCLDTTSVV